MSVPSVDVTTRRRLTARYGNDVAAWFATLPGTLAEVADRWNIAYDDEIPRGRRSVVFKCRMADSGRAVVKLSPDRARLAFEASALADWKGRQVPAVFAVDERLGALLLEAVEPGTPLADQPGYPPMETVAHLLRSLHATGVPRPSYPPVERRVQQLFESSLALYARHPHLHDLVPMELYERGRVLATRLARDQENGPTVLLHGDLTPNNLVAGGQQRGLVALDPAPCLGDMAFDAVDLLFWHADDLQTVGERAQELAAATGAATDRLLAWCTAFAAMVALERASEDVSARVEPLLELAVRA